MVGFVLVSILAIVALVAFALRKKQTAGEVAETESISYTVDCKRQDIAFYWQDDNGRAVRSIGNLKRFVERENRKLVFAMNGGMFNADNSPTGLFIQNRKTLCPLNTASGRGNFYLKPNGVFYITTDGVPNICKTQDFTDSSNVKYATQSGPMLVVDGKIHASFKADSKSVNIRNGVGILPDGKVMFAISKTEVNFYGFADFFRKSGCRNALYLDGFVSRMYLPERNWLQTDGDFGVMIVVTEAIEK